MIPRLTLFALAACLGIAATDVSCGPRAGYAVHIDESFSDEEKAEIVAALGEWNWKTGGRVQFDSVDYVRHGAADHFRTAEDLWIARPDYLPLVYTTALGGAQQCPGGRRVGVITRDGGHDVGLTYRDGASWIVCLDSDWSRAEAIVSGTDYFPRIVLHEVGHSLGLEHYAGPGPSVMYPGIPDCATGIECVDVAQFCAVSGDCQLTYADCEVRP